ncbi:hypothetical protein BDW60DRAFT_188017 [Aspergillus nidulans var. acristatus]
MWTPWTRRGVQPESLRGRPSLHSGQLHSSNSTIFHAQREIELRFLLQLIERIELSCVMVSAHIRDADRGAGEPQCVTTCSDPYQTRPAQHHNKTRYASAQTRDNHSLSLVLRPAGIYTVAPFVGECTQPRGSRTEPVDQTVPIPLSSAPRFRTVVRKVHTAG